MASHRSDRKPADLDWERVEVHPANTAPRMSNGELRELADDIRKHGLQEPIVLFQDNSAAPKGSAGPFPYYLLDGVNRREALKLNGIADPYQAQHGDIRVATVIVVRAFRQSPQNGKWEIDTDPLAFHLSMNTYRRHLTREQRRWQIKQMILANPIMPDRKIEKIIGIGHGTAARIRADMLKAGPNGAMLQNAPPRNPFKRAKEVADVNPDLGAYKLAKKARVSIATAKRARKALITNSLPSKYSASPTRLKAMNQATQEYIKWIIKTAKPAELPTIVTWLRLVSSKQVAEQLAAHLQGE